MMTPLTDQRALPSIPFQDESDRREMLGASIFFPAIGGTWDVLPLLAQLGQCVIAADYAVPYSRYEKFADGLALTIGGTRYRALAGELIPPDWQPPDCGPDQRFIGRLIGEMRRNNEPFPFYEWIVANRPDSPAPTEDDSGDGKARRVLYLSDEALWTYHGLYTCRGIAPRYLVIPPPGLGANTWTPLEDETSEFGKEVLKPGRPRPEFLLQFSPDPLWPKTFGVPTNLPGLPEGCGLYAFARTG